MKKHLLFLFLTTAVFAQPEIPALKNWVTDYTSTLSSQELNTLNSRLRVYEDTTTNQLVSLMIYSLDDYPIEYYAFEVAEKNKIGTKENENGVLLFIAKNDRKLRIEVGYGLEGVLPDALASSIIRNEIVPHFRNENYYDGISAGIDAIIKAIGGEYAAEPGSSKNKKPTPGIFTILMIIFFIVMFFLRGGRRRRGFVYYGGGWGGSGWGGGGSSGGFGGFSGGGGSFGGGGASGSW